MSQDSAQTPAEPRRVEIVVSGATVFKAALVALGVFILIIANEVFLTILLSLVFALGLDPLVGWFTRRGWGRGKAALMVFFLLFLAVSVIVIWVATPLWNEVKGLANEIPGYIDDLKDEPAFKQLHENTDAVDKAQEVAKDAAKAIPEAASALLGITGALVGTVFSIVTLSFLTLFAADRAARLALDRRGQPGRGAAPLLRGHHARGVTAVPDLHPDAFSVRLALVQHAVALSRRAAGRARHRRRRDSGGRMGERISCAARGATGVQRG